LIPLTDPKWREYPGNYNDGTRVTQLLQQALEGTDIEEWYDDLFQELCHQYTVSKVAYAAAPYLVKIARSPGAPRLELLILLGTCHAFNAASVPAELEDEWRDSAVEALPLAAELLSQPISSEAELRNLLSALAAFNGHRQLAKAIESLDSDLEWDGK